MRYFLEAANEGNITRAARNLHITQPSLSRQLMLLEHQIGRKLYTRESAGIRLTEDGMLLKKRAAEILDLEAKTREELSANDASIHGTVYLGAGETAGIKHIAVIIRSLREKFPGIHYRMISGDAEDITDKLDKGLVDFGLFVGKVDLNKYDCITLPDSDRWGAIVRTDDKLAKYAGVAPKDLLGRELLFSHQAMIQGEFSEWLGCPAEELDIIGTHNLVYNASVMVREGVGVLITIEGIVNSEGLKFIPLKPKISAGLVLAWKKGAVFSKAAAKFLELADCEGRP